MRTDGDVRMSLYKTQKGSITSLTSDAMLWAELANGRV